MEEENNPDSLREIMKKNNELLNKVLSVEGAKKLKLKTLGKGAKSKGYVNFLYIRENKEIEPLKVPVSEMTAIIEETPRLASPDYMLSYKNSPTIILPAWSSRPFSATENFEKTVEDKMLSAGWRLLANRAEQGDVKTKKKISGTAIFFIIVAVLIAGYLILF